MTMWEATMRWTMLAVLAMVACKGTTTPTDTDTEDTDASDCVGLGENTCGEVEGCVAIEGTPVNGALQFAGCATDSGECGEAETAAENPDGDCWDFPNTCIPDGWTNAGSSCTAG